MTSRLIILSSDQVNTKISNIDVLINNAGVFKSSQPITKNGHDIRIVVNYYAPFVFTNAILDTIKKSNEPRIINLSSAAQGSVSVDLLNGNVNVSDQEAYAQSKLAILMWSFYLAKQESEIAVVALNPGSLLNTNMVKEAYGRFWSSADKGADIIYDLALAKTFKEIDGEYYDNDRGGFGSAHPDAYDANIVEALMQKTKHIIKASD